MGNDDQKGFFNRVRAVLQGSGGIKVASQSIINLDVDPFTPEGMKVEEHQGGGDFKYDSTKIKLYLSAKQQKNQMITGYDLLEEIKNKGAYNANLLDFYLKNQHLISKDWEDKTIIFPGTIYRYSGDLCVRCLCSGGKEYYWSCLWLNNKLGNQYFVAVSV